MMKQSGPRGIAPAGGRAAQPARRRTAASASLSGNGSQISPGVFRIKQLVGQGSFGEVFEGQYNTDGGGSQRVIMKRVKSKVAGADKMNDNEHLLNVYVAKNAAGSCADFLGYTVVQSSADVSDRRITPGKWLLWRYQGLNTLGEYLRRRDCVAALAADLGVPERSAIATCLQQLLQSIQKLHAAGLVHRDVKPSNIIFCEADRTFRLIDLGAMADLRTGVNYCPDESILDPYYCPPEQYALPTDAPDLASKPRVMSLAISSMLWSKHKPDRFDMYSVGLIFLQLALPHLRTKSALQSFHASFKRCRYDLTRWRTVSALSPAATAALDADGGAGWQLAEALLRPRKVQVLADGHVYFTNEGQQRLSAEQALQSAYVSAAARAGSVAEGEASAAAAGDEGPELAAEREAGLFGMFRRLTGRVKGLERDIVRTAERAEEQTTTVHKLRKAVAEGAAEEKELVRAEGLLASLTGSLQYLQAEMETTARGADVAFRRGLLGTQHVGTIEAQDRARSRLEDERRRAGGAAMLGEPSGAGDTSGSEAEDAASTSGQDARGGWGLSGAFLLGIRSMGRAVQISGKVVEAVSSEAHSALGRYVKGSLSTAEASFMTMLDEGGITAGNTWADAQARLLRDVRFQAVDADARLALFQRYVRARRDIDALNVSDDEKAFMRQLSYRVTTPDRVTWQGVRAAWKDEAVFAAVGERAAEIIFVRHITQLQMQAAEAKKAQAAELTFRSALEALEPPISPASDWLDVRRAVAPAVASRVPETRRIEIFSELQREAVAAAKLAAEQTVAAAAAAASAAGGSASAAAISAPSSNTIGAPEEDLEVLSNLRKEQARIKAEYDGMERKLKAMEARLIRRSEQAAASKRAGKRAASQNGAAV